MTASAEHYFHIFWPISIYLSKTGQNRKNINFIVMDEKIGFLLSLL